MDHQERLEVLGDHCRVAPVTARQPLAPAVYAGQVSHNLLAHIPDAKQTWSVYVERP